MPFSKRQPLDFAVSGQTPAALAEPPAETQAQGTRADAARAMATAAEPRPPSGGTAARAVSNASGAQTTALAATGLTRFGYVEHHANQAPYLIALIASIVWLMGLAAFAFGLGPDLGLTARGPLSLLILAVLAAAPLGFAWAAAFTVAQARGLAAEAARAGRLADELLGPAAIAAAETGSMVELLRTRIDDASLAAIAASERMATMHQALAGQADQLAQAASTADRTARRLVESLSNQRGELNTLAVTLDARAAAVTDAINRQARMVADASDLAETQLREAEASLAARAADLGAAAAEAGEASRTASQDLARQVSRLETAGVGVGDQLRSLEDGLTHQRAALVTAAHAMRADQEDFASLTETRTAQLATFLEGAGRDVVALNEVTTLGARSLSELVEAAAARFRELADAARHERELFGASAVTSLKALSEVGANERRALEEQTRKTIQALSGAASQAREAADVHAEAARARVEQLNEVAFAAGQRADQVFETRLSEARSLIAQSAKLVEEAGASTADNLERGVAQAREALEELKRMVAAVGGDMARLPAETEARAEEVRAAVARGVEALLATARRTAEETQSIDAAFQERVKRNYEMLSEAVQLMGVVASRGQESRALPPPPAKRVRAAESKEETDAPPSAPDPKAPPASRTRLRLTAPAKEAEAAQDFPAAAAEPESKPAKVAPPKAEAPRSEIPRPEVAKPKAPKADAARAAGASSWSWKGVLDAVDGPPNGPQAELGGAVGAEITAMGIDPAALLARGRVQEIAAAVQVGDKAGAREVVRGLAPAAVRRLSRRLISDADFRDTCRSYHHRQGVVVGDAAKRDPSGIELASLLARDDGRAYLLIDAAIGETP